MKIYVYPADRHGCGNYRLKWPAEALQRCGYDVKIMPPEARNMSVGLDANDNVTHAIIPDDADVIVIQRVTHKYLADSVKHIRDLGVAVVVDIDDDLAHIHPKNPAWVNLHPRKHANPRSPAAKHSWEHAATACANATVVTCTSEALLRRYAGHGRGVILRNYVPQHALAVTHIDSDVIGWGGSIHSHPDDPAVIGGAIARLTADGHTFRVVGPPLGVKETFGLTKQPEITGSVTDEMWFEVLTTLGVGVAPLSDTVFNAAKSWLKPLEYAAVGVPSVVSPRAEYRELAKRGIGITADKPKHWYRELKKLITDDAYRRDESARVREIAAELTIDKQVWQWAEIYEKAASNP